MFSSADCKGSKKANSCYMISSESSARLSQGDAQLRCSLIHSSHLLTIDSTEELTFIRGLHLGHTNVNTTYWIGLKSEYIWLDGTKANYQTFVRKARSHGQGDMCYKLDPWNGFMWDDHYCTGKRYSYICERELPARKQLHTSGILVVFLPYSRYSPFCITCFYVEELNGTRCLGSDELVYKKRL